MRLVQVKSFNEETLTEEVLKEIFDVAALDYDIEKSDVIFNHHDNVDIIFDDKTLINILADGTIIKYDSQGNFNEFLYQIEISEYYLTKGFYILQSEKQKLVK
jgi:hypothetical protein